MYISSCVPVGKSSRYTSNHGGVQEDCTNNSFELSMQMHMQNRCDIIDKLDHGSVAPEYVQDLDISSMNEGVSAM